MSAEQQFLQPALREIAARNGLGQERSVKAIKYVRAPLLIIKLVLMCYRYTIVLIFL